MHLTAGLFLILAMICSASTALFLRIFSSSSANRYGIILGNYLTCALTGLLLLENRNLIFHARPVTYLCGLAGGIFFVLSLLCIQSSIGRNGTILTSAFSKLGLLVPLSASILFFHENRIRFRLPD